MKYQMSGKIYKAESPEDFLRQVAAKNSHTMNLDLQDYMDNVAAEVINSMTKHEVPIPANADDIVEAWKSMGILETEDKNISR